MKINEIEYGHWQEPTLPEGQPILDATQVGEFDHRSIYQIDDYLFIPDEQMCYMGYIRVDGNILKEAYVSKDHQRKGVASSLILFTIRTLGKKLTILANEIVTDDSRRLYYNLAKSGKVKIYADDILLPLKELGEFFVDINNNANVTLTLESQIKKISETCNELWNPETCLAGSNKVTFGPHVRDAFYYD